MKKAVKWISLVGVALVVIVGAVGVIVKQSDVDPAKEQTNNEAKAKRADGKIFAMALFVELQMLQVEQGGQAPDWEKFSATVANISPSSYRFGFADRDSEVAKHCPECKFGADTFKVAIYGDIDGDSQLDVMTIDHQKQLLLIQDDLEEASVPLNLTPTE